MTQPRRRSGGSRKPPDGDDEQQPTLGNPDADPVRIHREYVERRLGGVEPTPEDYARARRQWRRLPGAVSAPPGELAGEPEPEGEERREGGDASDPGDEGSRPA